MRKTLMALLVFLSSWFLIATTTAGQRVTFYGQNTSAAPAGCPFTDNFAGAGALNGSWTNVSSGFAASGVINQASGFARIVTPGTIGVSIVTGGGCVFPNDQSAQTVANEVDGRVMPMVRATSGGNGYGVYVQASGGVLILLMTGGSGAVIGSNTCSYATSNTYKIGIVGSVITAYQNGTSCGTATDTTYTTGVPGLFIDNNGSSDVTHTQALSFQAD